MQMHCSSGTGFCQGHVAEHGPSGGHDHEPDDQVVHMDIKPANILLEDSSCRVAKLADLGISRYLVEGSLGAITSCGMSLLRVGVCTCMGKAAGRTGRHEASVAQGRCIQEEVYHSVGLPSYLSR